MDPARDAQRLQLIAELAEAAPKDPSARRLLAVIAAEPPRSSEVRARRVA